MEHTEVSSMGGRARAKKLTKAERSESARKAVNARWDKRRRALAAAKRKPRGGKAAA